ncbi:hypothetical protein GWN63_01480, partial [Candidatus Bathyarchaeota archaeon]|nr:hypothetical protein [Candidatus Bathyarchaeota archaeon]NIU80908.1 hypothetical protein [Candidatus Bathyarchaeota archaeon]NIV67563.1 hypothetical protein [Candidatus Bathyarchaeota archaeon]NIW34181.1 hypothetical protein [Candidatus Bathyarchaeota archaeon]
MPSHFSKPRISRQNLTNLPASSTTRTKKRKHPSPSLFLKKAKKRAQEGKRLKPSQLGEIALGFLPIGGVGRFPAKMVREIGSSIAAAKVNKTLPTAAETAGNKRAFNKALSTLARKGKKVPKSILAKGIRNTARKAEKFLEKDERLRRSFAEKLVERKQRQGKAPTISPSIPNITAFRLGKGLPTGKSKLRESAKFHRMMTQPRQIAGDMAPIGPGPVFRSIAPTKTRDVASDIERLVEDSRRFDSMIRGLASSRKSL